MPTQINSNSMVNFQKFVDFANGAYATDGAKGADVIARFTGMPKGDYNCRFASFLRTSEMKAANDQVRDLFLKSIAGMFGGEKYIPDLVRDNMKLEDFGKGKPLTARRIKLVATAVNMLGGGKFQDAASVGRATAKGYTAAELPKLARVANLYQQATNCSEAEAEAAALDPGSKARRLFDYGGRFTLNADNFKKGLALMDKFATWFGILHDDCAAKKLDTPTKLNLNFTVCTRESAAAVQQFLFEEIAVNGKLSLDAANPEDLFGMAKNPAMRFVGRGYTTSFSNSLAQIPPEKRGLIYSVFDALDKLPLNAGDLANRQKVGYALLVAARVMKNFDAVAALQSSRKFDRAHLMPIIFPDLGLAPGATNRQINEAYEARMAQNPEILASVHMLAENSGATLDEVAAAINSGTRLENAPGISSFSGKLEELDGTARGGRKTMIYDLVRPTTPHLTANEQPVLADEDAKFVFNFPDGESLDASTGSIDDPDVRARCDAIADKIAGLCGNVHPKQLSNVYFALSQSAIGVNVTNAKIAAARKLSSRSSGFDIHRAVTEFRDNLMRAMTASGAEEATDGPNEKQACRNFFGEVMMGRCGANTLRAMQGAFAGDTPGKMLAFYEDISHGHHNEGLGHEITAKFENEADSHMMNLANLKGAIDVALDGHFGADVVPYNGSFIANEIGGEEILDDLVNIASR